MKGTLLRRVVNAWALQTKFRLLARTAKTSTEAVDPGLLEAVIVTAFKKLVDPISTIHGRGIGDLNRYAFLTVSALTKLVRSHLKNPRKGINWGSDYLPKIRAVALDEKEESDLREVAVLYSRFFLTMKKIVGRFLGGINTQNDLNDSYTLSVTLNKLRQLGDVAEEQATRVSKLQEATQVELQYVLQPTARGHLVGFDLFKSVPVGHDKPFFSKYHSRDYHFTFLLEEDGKWNKMKPTPQWSADKISKNEFNLGVSGSFKTNKENKWKSVKVLVTKNNTFEPN